MSLAITVVNLAIMWGSAPESKGVSYAVKLAITWIAA
jgi:hypothetical protein